MFYIDKSLWNDWRVTYLLTSDRKWWRFTIMTCIELETDFHTMSGLEYIFFYAQKCMNILVSPTSRHSAQHFTHSRTEPLKWFNRELTAHDGCRENCWRTLISLLITDRRFIISKFSSRVPKINQMIWRLSPRPWYINSV